MASKMTFQFLDVGMGDGTLVQLRPNGQSHDTLALVDFGEALTQFKVGWKDALTYLVDTIASNSSGRGLDYPLVDHLFITHPDRDHQNKIRPLCEARFPGLDKPLRFGAVRYGGTEDAYPDKLIAELKKRCGDVSAMEENWGSPVNGDGGVDPYLVFGSGKDAIKLYVLSVNYPTMESEPNPMSIVLSFELEGQRVILPGDAEAPTETAILERYAKVPGFLRAFGLKLGHHGSRNATSSKWVSAVKPGAIFASADSVWHHPYCEPICRVIAGGTLEKAPPWYVCGNESTYYNNKAAHAVCMNIWYMSQKGEWMLQDPDNKEVWSGAGTAWGVQWELRVESGGGWNIASTNTAVPKDASTAGDAWVCTGTGLADAATATGAAAGENASLPMRVSSPSDD